MFRNVVLVGFMGTGKTTIGKAVAERMGWVFADTDHMVEALAGKSIKEIFAAEGEEVFRQLETEALRELLSGTGQVIATGGGAVLKEENRRLMLEGGLVAALRAEEASITARVRGDQGRPLLQGDLEERVRTLMEARRFAYDFAPLQLDTDVLTIEAAAEQIQELLKEGC